MAAHENGAYPQPSTNDILGHMQESLLRRLEQLVPFEIASAKVLTDGAANLAVEVNDAWIFRSARRPVTLRQMALENAFLPKFKGHSPIPLPSIIRSGADFMLYGKIEGQPLRTDVLAALSPRTRDTVARQLGSFLTALHGFRFSHPDLIEFPYGGGDFWQDLWPLAAPQLSEPARRNAEAYFERSFQAMSQTFVPKTLVHADLGTSNILFNASDAQISGIIDFGDLCLHDPARDFNGILRNHGRAFTEQVLGYYDRDIGENAWKRIDFYAKKHWFTLVYYAPLFGFEEGIPVFLRNIETDFAKD